MKVIIALRGSGSTGKTTAIEMLRSLMIDKGFAEADGNHQQFKDFWCIFEKDGDRVGITSSGDNCYILKGKLDILNRAGCKIIVCACRSWGQTNELLDGMPGFKVRYVEKKVDSKSQINANSKDALVLLNMIMSFI